MGFVKWDDFPFLIWWENHNPAMFQSPPATMSNHESSLASQPLIPQKNPSHPHQPSRPSRPLRRPRHLTCCRKMSWATLAWWASPVTATKDPKMLLARSATSGWDGMGWDGVDFAWKNLWKDIGNRWKSSRFDEMFKWNTVKPLKCVFNGMFMWWFGCTKNM